MSSLRACQGPVNPGPPVPLRDRAEHIIRCFLSVGWELGYPPGMSAGYRTIAEAADRLIGEEWICGHCRGRGVEPVVLSCCGRYRVIGSCPRCRAGEEI